jgi:hypothetical protein
MVGVHGRRRMRSPNVGRAPQVPHALELATKLANYAATRRS